ncbi:MAG TPA: cellulase, partial [Pseudomonas sp.]|nr:cellulase [Pseudomonas sp.]
TPTPTPTPAPAPAAPSSAYSAGLNSFTNEDWDNGIYRKAAGFSIPDTAANKAAFVTGASVKLADGQVRKVAAVYDVGAHLSVMLSGSALSASAVGYPKTISVVSSTSGTTTPPASAQPAPAPAPAPTPAPAPSTPVVSDGSGIDLVGVNFGSGVFDPSNVPGIYNKGYTYADESYYKRHAGLGFKLVRLGFLWERIQPKLGTELDAAELGRIKQSLDYAQKYGIKVILDMHNYYRYYGKVINSPEVPRAQFAETWRKIAVQVSKHPALYGYGLMNEPYNTGNNLWPQTAQAAGQAIRKVDPTKWIMIAGDRYSSAFHWQKYNTQLINDPWMRDPKNNLVYEAHQYLDYDYSGTYSNRAETFAPMLGVERVKPWVEWLKKNKLRGYIGEHGIPDFSPSAVVATDKLLAYLAENCIPSTYWAAGPRWGENIMALDVASGKHRPQLAPLQKHAAAKKTCSTIGPL